MKNRIVFLMALVSFLLLTASQNKRGRSTVEIRGEQFYVNGNPTYAGRYWNGHKIEGLLINSRMVQGIFDDLNPETRETFVYPDTKKWDADRNTNEFVHAMDEWYKYGLNSFTLNLQGGSPTGYGNKPWINTAYHEDGKLRDDYMGRLEKILDKADDLSMVVILGLFYFGQDQHLQDEKAVKNAVKNVVDWLFKKGYRNILIEINNECDVKEYDHDILKSERVHTLINFVKSMKKKGYRYLVSTSFRGDTAPSSNVVKASDYLLIHGNGVQNYEKMQLLIDNTRSVEGYRPMPVVVNEDDHFNFAQDKNNFVAAIEKYVSWGYFDYRKKGEDHEVGFQSVPVDWGINSDRKKAFFNKVKAITGGH